MRLHQTKSLPWGFSQLDQKEEMLFYLLGEGPSSIVKKKVVCFMENLRQKLYMMACINNSTMYSFVMN